MEKKEKNEKNATHTIQMKALWIVSTSRLNVYQDWNIRTFRKLLDGRVLTEGMWVNREKDGTDQQP